MAQFWVGKIPNREMMWLIAMYGMRFSCGCEPPDGPIVTAGRAVSAAAGR